MTALRRVPPVEPESAAVPKLDEKLNDPRARARDARGPDAPQPSAPPEVPQEGERALVTSTGVRYRRCENCGEPLSGRAAKRACSARCRAAWSRRRRAEERAARDREIRGLLEQAQTTLQRALQLLRDEGSPAR